MVFSARYCDNTSEIPDANEFEFNSDVTFTLVSSEAPAIGAAPAMMGDAVKDSAHATEHAVMRNDL
jgi:hypothetical protein